MLIDTPSGNKIIPPGFFDGEQDDILLCGARLTPLEIGNYSYQFKIQNQCDTIFTKTISFKVIPSKRKGFLRLNSESDYTFKFDSIQSFRAFGEHVCWTDAYEYYVK